MLGNYITDEDEAGWNKEMILKNEAENIIERICEQWGSIYERKYTCLSIRRRQFKLLELMNLRRCL